MTLSLLLYWVFCFWWGYFSAKRGWSVWAALIPAILVGIVRIILVHNRILNW